MPSFEETARSVHKLAVKFSSSEKRLKWVHVKSDDFGVSLAKSVGLTRRSPVSTWVGRNETGFVDSKLRSDIFNRRCRRDRLLNCLAKASKAGHCIGPLRTNLSLSLSCINRALLDRLGCRGCLWAVSWRCSGWSGSHLGGVLSQRGSSADVSWVSSVLGCLGAARETCSAIRDVPRGFSGTSWAASSQHEPSYC